MHLEFIDLVQACSYTEQSLCLEEMRLHLKVANQQHKDFGHVIFIGCLVYESPLLELIKVLSDNICCLHSRVLLEVQVLVIPLFNYVFEKLLWISCFPCSLRCLRSVFYQNYSTTIFYLHAASLS